MEQALTFETFGRLIFIIDELRLYKFSNPELTMPKIRIKGNLSTNNNNEGFAKITYMVAMFANGKDEIKQLLLQLLLFVFDCR